MTHTAAFKIRGIQMSVKVRGFSLIELLVAIAILGVLTAIAMPSYSSYTRRANRVIGKTTVMQIVSRQESFMSDRKGYATSLTALGYPADTVYVSKNGGPSASSANALYSITLATYTAANMASCNLSGTPTALQFAVVATPLGPQTKDTECLKLCYSHLGEKGDSGPSSDCWSR